MAGKYGCPWTNIMCIQSCGCCKDCEKAKKELPYSEPSCACGIYNNNKNKPEMEDKNNEGQSIY